MKIKTNNYIPESEKIPKLNWEQNRIKKERQIQNITKAKKLNKSGTENKL